MGFHVPRVTINIDFKEGTSFGELSLISLGYGLHQAWIYSSMFDRSGIFGLTSLEASPFNDQLSLAYFTSILIYGLILLVASILDTKLVKALHSTAMLVGSALLGAVGTLLLLVPASMVPNANLLQAISGLLTGTGSSILLLAWGVVFARQDSASIVINGALSITIGFGIYGLVLHQIPFPAGGVASALIPFLEVYLLLKLRQRVSLDFDNRRLFFQPLPINHSRFVFRFGLPVFFLGMALGIVRQTSIETILPGAGFEDQAILFVTGCITTLLIMVTFLALGGDERWHTFFRPLIPFIAITALFIPLADNGNAIWSISIVLIGYMSFEALMWIFFAELSQRFRLSPIFVFGLGRGTMALAALGGSTLPLFSDAFMLPVGFGEAGMVVIVIMAMMLAYALLPDEREMATIVSVVPNQATATRAAARTPLIVVNEGAAPSPDSTHADRAVDDAVKSVPAQPGAIPEGARNDSDGSEGSGGSGNSDSVPVAAAVALEAPLASEAKAPLAAALDSPSEAAAPRTPSPARQAMDFSRSIFADDTADDTPLVPLDDSPAARGRFRERCEIVANTYLPSRRENEVMYYLARGYKSSYIQQQLFISEGTAKTHIRHIYRKLNIHSQQELIHLIDEVEL